MTGTSTDLKMLHDALLADPLDETCWGAYGDAFEDRYGPEVRKRLAWRQVYTSGHRRHASVRNMLRDVQGIEDAGQCRQILTCSTSDGTLRRVLFRYGLPHTFCIGSHHRVPLTERARQIGKMPLSRCHVPYSPMRIIDWARLPGECWGVSQPILDPLYGCPSWPVGQSKLFIFLRLAAGHYDDGREANYVGFPTKKAASRALSFALVNLYRHAVGLPLVAEGAP